MTPVKVILSQLKEQKQTDQIGDQDHLPQKGDDSMKSNLILQIEQIENKIKRLQAQKEYYEKILEYDDPEHNSIKNKEQNTMTPELCSANLSKHQVSIFCY